MKYEGLKAEHKRSIESYLEKGMDVVPLILNDKLCVVDAYEALAQIAEEKRETLGCDVCRGIVILSGTFHGIIAIDKDSQMEVDSDGDVDFDFCPVCGRSLKVFHTEGKQL